MPSYRSITISLRVAANCKEVAEYQPPTPYSLTQSTGNNLQPSHPPPPSNHSNLDDPFTSPPVNLLDIPRSIVSVYTIIHDHSNFWLQYSIAPPYPPNALYYFKLFINGTEVASWGCGQEEGWRGCTMWGIFLGDNGRMERRDFWWAKQTDGGDGVMEVKVFRAKGRMRVVPEVGRWEGLERRGREISVTKGGALPRKLPRRYYRYALLDSLDVPFATFRYYCRSWRQLNALGVKNIIESSVPSSRTSHASDSENEEQEREDAHRRHDDCSPNLSTITGSSGSSGASSGEELLTRFASSGLESRTDVTMGKGTAAGMSSTQGKANSKETKVPTNRPSSPIRHIPRPLALVPKPYFLSVAPPQVPMKDSPASNHNSMAPPPVPPKHSQPTPTTAIPPRSALFSPKPRPDALTSPTLPAKTPRRSPPTLPPRSALFSPKNPHPTSLPRSLPRRTPKPRSSREQFAAMIREGFPSPESARWKLDEERYASSGNESADFTPEEGERRTQEGDRKGGRDSMENEGHIRGSASGEGKALKQGTLRMGMLKRVVENAVSRMREG